MLGGGIACSSTMLNPLGTAAVAMSSPHGSLIDGPITGTPIVRAVISVEMLVTSESPIASHIRICFAGTLGSGSAITLAAVEIGSTGSIAMPNNAISICCVASSGYAAAAAPCRSVHAADRSNITDQL